ncbi:MAG: GSU2403 family nucleotidyltransferase fold protein [Pseudomonadota bacterium]
MKTLSLPIQSLFSDLEQRIHDADFTETFDPGGSFAKKKRHNKFYWYWQRREGKKVIQKYVGPFTDKAITDRVKRFSALKSDYDERREIVRSLLAAGLPRPEFLSGEVTESMCRAGFFRLRGVLVGTAAYQCYAGILGCRLPHTTTGTADADFAQFFAIANLLDDSLPPILDVLHEVDSTFHPVPHSSGSPRSTSFINDSKFRVEFLTPNRGSDDYEGKPASMPALSGAAAEPLRFLDFLIRNPVRSVLLHGGGVPVTVPSPERYAVHKLIVAERRHDTMASKINKDIAQAAALIEAMRQTRFVDLSSAWQEAWERGPTWRQELMNGIVRLDKDTVSQLGEAVKKGAKRRRKDALEFWPENFV